MCYDFNVASWFGSENDIISDLNIVFLMTIATEWECSNMSYLLYSHMGVLTEK